MARVLADYERHLVVERDLAAAHGPRLPRPTWPACSTTPPGSGTPTSTELDLRTLRSWLAKQQTLGRSRTTLARRATAARVFTAWLARTGRAPTDVGASLGLAQGAHRRCRRCCAPTRPPT